MPEDLSVVPDDQILVSVNNAARMFDCSPDYIYKLLRDPTCPLESRWLGGKRVILVETLREFARTLPAERRVS